ncbi:MAG TPA: hypothetical protein VFF52_09525, partial [Isosphaeraceae bacterium]|nr:hypothetical protein [Isosphaeraceae bacterium]
VSQFGANQFTPSIAALSAYNYAPIPLAAALQQYLPADGFNARLYSFNHHGKALRHSAVFATSTPTELWDQRPVMTLPQHVLDRSRFHAGKSYTWTHTKHSHPHFTAVVPIQESVQSVVGTPGIEPASTIPQRLGVPGSHRRGQ